MAEYVTASTGSGAVRGRVESGLAVFRGVPYAAAPVGERRFRTPVPPVRWVGVRDALSFGPTAPKPAYPDAVAALLVEPEIAGDDILNLNVWTPDLSAAGLPVLVWLHGGAFTNGAGSLEVYDGATFARDGVVCVTLNYRLGFEGFGLLADAPANLGLRDQLAALRWVHENIAAFGGDPNRVTVAGQSAGAMSVATLLASPGSAGLFSRAICQSGAGHLVLTPLAAGAVTAAIARELGVAATAEDLAAVPMARLLAAQTSVAEAVSENPDPSVWHEITANMMPFEPVVDGDLVAGLPIDALRAGINAGVDVLIGSNLDEPRLYADVSLLDDATVGAVAAAYGLSEDAVACYHANRPGASAGEVLTAMVTDWFYRIPAIRLAEAPGRRAWMYEFAWRSPKLGACHYLDVPFVFDALEVPSVQPLTDGQAPQRLADEMHGAWVRFVTSGDPGWPRYDTTTRTTMRFDASSGVVYDPRSDERALWAAIR